MTVFYQNWQDSSVKYTSEWPTKPCTAPWKRPTFPFKILQNKYSFPHTHLFLLRWHNLFIPHLSCFFFFPYQVGLNMPFCGWLYDLKSIAGPKGRVYSYYSKPVWISFREHKRIKAWWLYWSLFSIQWTGTESFNLKKDAKARKKYQMWSIWLMTYEVFWSNTIHFCLKLKLVLA